MLNNPKGIGINQTWKDFTGSRAPNTTYTNTENKPIMICVTVRSSAAGGVSAASLVDGLNVGEFGFYGNGAGYEKSNYVIVPAGKTYSIGTITNGTMVRWMELR